MFITYFIILIISILFRLLHWPGANILLLFSSIFPLIDILIQAIRSKEGKKLRLLSATGLTGIAVFLTFFLLEWPGGRLLFFAAIAMTIPYFIVFFSGERKMNLRFFLMAAITIFAAVNISMKNSTRTEFYMLEKPFSQDRLPSYILRDLAFDYYHEGQPGKASILLHKALNQLEKQSEYFSTERPSDFERIVIENNTEAITQDLNSVKNKNWEYRAEMIYEDFYTPE